eukprot:Pgem_evm2s2896
MSRFSKFLGGLRYLGSPYRSYGMAQRVSYNGTKVALNTLNPTVVACFSIGRLVASVILGYLSDYISERKVLLGASFISILGSILYIFAYQEYSIWMLVCARLTHGVGAGCLSVVRAHTSKITTVKQRTKYMALNGAAQYAALGIAPFIAVASTAGANENSIWNTYTAPAFIIIITSVINIFLLMFVFVDINLKDLKKDKQEIRSSGANDPKWDKIILWGTIMYIFFNFSS